MRSFTCLSTLGAVALMMGAGPGTVLAAGESSEPSVWEHHQGSTAFFGQTSAYTCSGLEDEVKHLLLYFGARPDLQVKASCPDPIRPVNTAVVTTDFYSLQPASASASDTVSGRWVPIELMPQRPLFMGRGECELVDQFKGVLTQGFSFRDLKYHALCFPHDVSTLDYTVRGLVLKPKAHP
jgi:hypothetical protein